MQVANKLGVAVASALVLQLVGCAAAPTPRPAAAPPPVALSAATSASAMAARPLRASLPWLDNDAPRALALAKQSKRPLFIDFGATWCHSCVHMHEVVFRDAELARYADAVVWLDIDIDKPENAEFVAKYAPKSFPTYVVLNAAGEELDRIASTMSSREVVAAVTMSGAAARVDLGADATGADSEAQAPALRELLKLSAAHEYAACADGGLRALDTAGVSGDEVRYEPRTFLHLNLLTIAYACAAEVRPATARGSSVSAVVAREQRLRAALEAQIGSALLAPPALRAAYSDDISSAYEQLVDADPVTHAPAIAARWAAFLEERAASEADSPAARRSLDPHRLLAYLALGQPLRARAMLEQSALEAPRDFNPPARLAKMYRAAKDWPNALSACKPALQLVYGPRILRVGELCADIAKAAGAPAVEGTVLRDVLARTDTLTLTASGTELRAQLRARLRALNPLAAAYSR